MKVSIVIPCYDERETIEKNVGVRDDLSPGHEGASLEIHSTK